MNNMTKIKMTYYGVVRSKKNSKRIVRNSQTGKMAIVSNNAAKVNEQDMAMQFATQFLQAQPVKMPCEICITIYEPNYTRRDLDNQATSILDALKKASVIADDDFKNVRAIHALLGGIDRKNPRAEVVIMEVQNGKI